MDRQPERDVDCWKRPHNTKWSFPVPILDTRVICYLFAVISMGGTDENEDHHATMLLLGESYPTPLH